MHPPVWVAATLPLHTWSWPRCQPWWLWWWRWHWGWWWLSSSSFPTKQIGITKFFNTTALQCWARQNPCNQKKVKVLKLHILLLNRSSFTFLVGILPSSRIAIPHHNINSFGPSGADIHFWQWFLQTRAHWRNENGHEHHPHCLIQPADWDEVEKTVFGPSVADSTHLRKATQKALKWTSSSWLDSERRLGCSWS